MSNDDLETKIEFVEKMKRENPRAFAFLGQGATNLLASLERELEVEFFDWFNRAIKIMNPQKIMNLLKEKISLLGV